MTCRKCKAMLTSPNGTTLQICPFCGLGVSERILEESLFEIHADKELCDKLYEAVQQGSDHSKEFLLDAVSGIFYNKTKLCDTIKLAVQCGVADEIAEILNADEERQKLCISQIAHTFIDSNKLNKMRATNAIKALALGIGVVNDVCEHIFLAVIPLSEIPRRVLSKDEASDLRGEFIEIPYGYTEIGKNAFHSEWGWSSNTLRKVSFPPSVNSIGTSAFQNCHSLEEIIIPATIRKIGASAFMACGSLAKLSIDGQIESMGESAFAHNRQLSEVVINGKGGVLGTSAFIQCEKLRSVKFNGYIEQIGQIAFAKCDLLIRIELPSGLTHIGGGAFYQCRRLKKVVIPDSVVDMGNEMFDNSYNVTVFCSDNSYPHNFCIQNRIPVNTTYGNSVQTEYTPPAEDSHADDENFDENAYLQAAEDGNAEAQFELAMCYTEGKRLQDFIRQQKGVSDTEFSEDLPQDFGEKDLKKMMAFPNAMKWLRTAAEQDEIRALTELADCNMFENSEIALEIYKAGAEQGYYRAQASLGVRYLYGDGVPEDKEKAVKLFLEAAKQGEARALYHLGELYKEVDPPRAIELYLMAAKQGEVMAQMALSSCYSQGIGVDVDKQEAIYWTKKTALSGLVESQILLGKIYLNGTPDFEQDLVQAVFWLRKAAAQGNNEAVCFLGDCYADVNYIHESPSKAASYYRKAAERGYALAQCKLAQCYEIGDGTDEDATQAVHWFIQAGEQGDISAQLALAHWYNKGINVEENLEQAVYWYTKAAERGNLNAIISLGDFHKEGRGFEKNPEEAVRLYQIAADKGHEQAVFNLAMCYSNGEGVEKDGLRAVYMLNQLVEDGSPESSAYAQQALNLFYAGVDVEKVKAHMERESIHEERNEKAEMLSTLKEMLQTETDEHKITQIKLAIAELLQENSSDEENVGVLNVVGNTVGNLVNLGFFASQGNWMYYSNGFDKGKLYRIRLDGSVKQKISDDVPMYINVVGEWVYFYNGANRNICRVPTDGGNTEILCNDDVKGPIIATDDWLFYCDADNTHIYKIRLDGSGHSVVNDDVSAFINICNGWLYYVDRDNSKIYKMKPHIEGQGSFQDYTFGDAHRLVHDDRAWSINVVDEWIYYSNVSDGGKLYRLRTKGHGRRKLTEHACHSINVAGEWVFYCNKDDSECLYRVRTDGSGNQKLTDSAADYITVIGEWVYYQKKLDDITLQCRMNIEDAVEQNAYYSL